MQKCESRTKRVMSAIIAGMMALQVVAPTISYADDADDCSKKCPDGCNPHGLR